MGYLSAKNYLFTDGLKNVYSDTNENSLLMDQLNAGNWDQITKVRLISEIRDRRFVPFIEENVMKIEEESA